MNMKETYEQKLQARLDQWQTDIDEMVAKADEVEADAQISYHKKIEELKSMQEEAKEKLAELKESGDDAWENLKAGIEDAWDSYGNAFNLLKVRFNK